MKYTVEQISTGEDELILKYKRLNKEVLEILNLMNMPQKKLIGFRDGLQTVIEHQSILYAESVDGKCFIYTADEVYRVLFSLTQLEEILNTINFFRCSKSMIINIDKVRSLKSLASNRIEAEMQNGEKIMISRTYASEFRRILKGVSADE